MRAGYSQRALIAACLGMLVTIAADARRENHTRDSVQVHIPLPDLTLHADLYPVPGNATAPALLLLHGWHWPDGQPATTMAPFARRFRAAGFHVLVPTLRGWSPSGGRDDCGGRQVDDMLLALDWLRSRPGIDADRVYLAGHSQGGQIALLMTARHAPVRATAAFAPVTHPASWGRQTSVDGIRDYLLDECGGRYGWQRRDVVAAAAAIRSPVLLVHGDSDTRVPASQSQRLYVRLEALDRPAELRLIAGSGHAIDDILRPEVALEFFARHGNPSPAPIANTPPVIRN